MTKEYLEWRPNDTGRYSLHYVADDGLEWEILSHEKPLAIRPSETPPLTGVEFLHTWMLAPNPMLGDKVPLEMLMCGLGHRVGIFIAGAQPDEHKTERGNL